jgi:hypothetical protein
VYLIHKILRLLTLFHATFVGVAPAAAGGGGIKVSFFISLMFREPHPTQPAPVFEDNFSNAGDC